MKLKVTDWKHAWFESHISDRFFQEMSKLEKGTVQGLESSAQWTEQIMIEVGLLAQAMIRLEHADASEPQIRQAFDKALRLSALALHLITALDGADREQIRSGSIVRGEHHERASRPAMPFGPGAAGQAAAAPPPEAPRPPSAAPNPMPASGAFAPAMPLGPVPLARPRTASAGPTAKQPAAAAPHGEAEATGHGGPGGDTPLFSSLVQVAGRDVPRSESQLRQTIVSLSQQGLSRAEIAMVTGEPRHVIEAVLNHARSQVAAQPG